MTFTTKHKKSPFFGQQEFHAAKSEIATTCQQRTLKRRSRNDNDIYFPNLHSNLIMRMETAHFQIREKMSSCEKRGFAEYAKIHA